MVVAHTVVMHVEELVIVIGEPKTVGNPQQGEEEGKK
jgi:hypothetical protein